MKQRDENKTITTDVFVRLVARESGFKVSEIRTIWKVMRVIMSELLINDRSVSIIGIGRLCTRQVGEKQKWNIATRNYDRSTKYKKIRFFASSMLKRAINGKSDHGLYYKKDGEEDLEDEVDEF